MSKGELLQTTNIKREPKCLYFLGTSETGMLEVRKATGKPGRKFKPKPEEPAQAQAEASINGSDSL
jgi:hypothetical protein